MDRLKILRDRVVSHYEQKTPGSRALFERAAKVLPGGASGNLRYFPPYPLYMSSGEGCHTVDIDGSAYIDCFSCNGPLLLGHRHPAVMSGVARLESVGSLVVNPEIMVEVAEKLQQVIPCAERVRFLNSGTEAVMSAIRYARAYTGKPKVVKFYGHYHGQDDQFLLGVAPNRKPFGAGIPDASYENTLTLRCDDIAELDEVLSSRDDVAAVIIDPAMHAGGLWGVRKEFLEALRTRTRERGIVLIFDEVITGFRMSLGGAQAYYGITPDLTTLAKALSGGERLAAFAAQDIGVHVNRLCSMMQLFITDLDPEYERYVGLNGQIQDLLHLALINEGVILSLPTSDHIYFSFMHDQAAFDEIAAALVTVLEKYPFAEAYQEQLQGR